MYRIILFVLGIFFVPFFAYADLGGDNIGGGEVIAGWREQASQDVIRARTIIMDAGTITNNNDGSINYHPASSDLVKANFIGKPLSSASLASALTDETGTGLAAFNTNPVFSGLVDNQTNDAATATVSELYRLTHTSTGTVAADFGAGIDTYLEDASGNSDLASEIATIWTDPTEASEDSAITFSGVSAGGALTEWGRFYGAASGTGGRLKVNTDNTAVTKTDGIILSNSTAATAGVPQQESPILVFSQQRWNGSSSDTYDIGIQATLNGSGDSIDAADGYLKFLVRTNGGAWTSFFTEQGNGNITLLNLMGFNVGEASNTATGLTIVNPASATSILDQFTPPLRFYSPGWKTNATAASQTMSLGYINAPEQGAVNPIGVHRVYYGTNTTTPDLSNELYRLEWGDRLGVVFNEPAADQDFRIESDTITNAFDLDGATGAITMGGALTVSGTTTLGTVAGAVDAGGATSFEFPNTAGDVTLAVGGQGAVDTTNKQLAIHDGTQEVVIPLRKVAQGTFDLAAQWDVDSDLWLCDLHADQYANGIYITAVYMDSTVADPTTELDANLMYCDAVAGGAFPGASPTLIVAVDTTTGNYSNASVNTAVAAGKSLYLDLDADPVDSNVQYHLRIHYRIEED